MVNNITDPYLANTPVKNSSNWWKWLLGILAVCVCLGCLGTVGVFYYFGQEPENLAIDYSMPSIVRKGENFDLVITMTNTGSTPFTIDDIDLDEVMGGSILDGSMVLTTEPEMERDYSTTGIKTFFYKQTLQPGETKQAIFHLQATTVGEFGGSIGVYIGDNAKRFDYVGLIVQE
jgi:hypothetical protein